MFRDIYRGKKVLVTGHTGFKGSWLTSWLEKLGANVVGVSNEIPTMPSMFDAISSELSLIDYRIDIRDLDGLKNIIDNEKPDFIFHLAAQPLVSESYANPVDTITSNVVGTMNLMESLRLLNPICTAVIITSDKAYDNVEQIWGYKENDALGGKDIYSGSKGAAELVVKSYFNSFFKEPGANPRIAIGRAGNVIGGGDWAKDRIVVDCMKSWSEGRKVEIRSPYSTRPWQHVLEPLSGYLTLGAALFDDQGLNGEAFNFGPLAEQNRTVLELMKDLSSTWGFNKNSDAFVITDNIPFHEAGLLKLNCDKALSLLRWRSNLNYTQTIEFTGVWYYSYYKRKSRIHDLTLDQINEYESIAFKHNLVWTV